MQPFKYWLEQINFIDRIKIQSYQHEEAHNIARTFFLKHTEYTHWLFLNDDVLIQPDIIKLLIRDDEENDFQIISGYCNWDFHRGWINATTKNLSNIRINVAEQYGFINIKDIFAGKYNFPFLKVYFEGLCGTLIRRDIIEKIPFKAYMHVNMTFWNGVFKDNKPKGMMFDLRFSNDCHKEGIPFIIDLRCFFMHGGNTIHLTDAVNIPKSCIFYGKDGTIRDF